MTSFSVLVVNLNNLDYTRNCLLDLSHQDESFELSLIDQNSSEPGTREFLEDFRDNHRGKFPFSEINLKFNDNNFPLNHLWNEFVENSTTKYCCLLNNDTRLSPNFFSSSKTLFELEKSVSFINHTTNKLEFSSWSENLEYVIAEEPYRQGWDPTFRREDFYPIPSELNFFYGDDYIYSQIYNSGKKGAYILNSPIIHYERSTTFQKGGQRDCTDDGLHFHSLPGVLTNLEFNYNYSSWKPEFLEINRKMAHFYQNIGENWFDYQELYTTMVNKYQSGSHFVEVGSWKGRSSAYMGVEIINSNKNIRFDCVDIWEYIESQQDIPEEKFENLFKEFLENTSPVSRVINPIKKLSIDASKLYPDSSLDFIFIDAAHDYDNVIQDIRTWLPKLKIGGCIAGHDYYTSPGIEKAVKEVFGEDYSVVGSCWFYENLGKIKTLHQFGLEHGTDKATHHNFLNFYESKIGHLKNSQIKLLEIGFLNGNSIRTWLDFFESAEIYCLDIFDVDFKHERFHYFKVSQDDPDLKFLFPNDFFDVIIDDGSHMTSHQLKSLEYLWPKLRSDGTYILEDLHTSFRADYVDTEVTTYEFVTGEKPIDRLEYLKHEMLNIEIFRRDSNSNWDSVTSAIKKIGRKEKIKLFDFCIFNNEHDILDLRLKYMSSFVDKFYVCEIDITHQSTPSAFHSHHFIDNYAIAQKLIAEDRLVFVRLHIDPSHEYFAVEKNHRIKFSEWVKNNIEDNFVGILSDCDEIISHNIVNFIGSVQDVIRLDLKMFYFAADNQSYLHPWNRLVKIFHKENLQDFDFQTIREMWTEKVIEDIGWHFSSFGGIDQVTDKIKSYSHTEFNNAENTARENLIARVSRGEDFLGRPEFPCIKYDVSQYPEALLNCLKEKTHLLHVEQLLQNENLKNVNQNAK